MELAYVLRSYVLLIRFRSSYKMTHLRVFGVQLMASVSIISSGPGSPFVPSVSLATNRKQYVVPGSSSSMAICTFPPFRRSFPIASTFCCSQVCW